MFTDSQVLLFLQKLKDVKSKKFFFTEEEQMKVFNEFLNESKVTSEAKARLIVAINFSRFLIEGMIDKSIAFANFEEKEFKEADFRQKIEECRVAYIKQKDSQLRTAQMNQLLPENLVALFVNAEALLKKSVNNNQNLNILNTHTKTNRVAFGVITLAAILATIYSAYTAKSRSDKVCALIISAFTGILSIFTLDLENKVRIANNEKNELISQNPVGMNLFYHEKLRELVNKYGAKLNELANKCTDQTIKEDILSCFRIIDKIYRAQDPLKVFNSYKTGFVLDPALVKELDDIYKPIQLLGKAIEQNEKLQKSIFRSA